MSTDERRTGATGDIYYREREAEIYDLEYAWVKSDIPFWVDLAREYAGANGRALELACGTGRVLLPVAAGGTTATGIDQSPWMLDVARRKLRLAPDPVQARVQLEQGDMRTFDLSQQYEFIYLPFNTFLILVTAQDQLAMLERVRAHLKPEGVFAFSMFVPDVNRLIPASEGIWKLELDQKGEGGRRFQRDNSREVDPVRQIMRNTFRMREYQDDALVHEWVSDLTLTYIFPRELEHLVARAGFEFVHYWADYSRTDFWLHPGPTQQLAVIRPR